MEVNHFSHFAPWLALDWRRLSLPSQFLLLYGAWMWLACAMTYARSRSDIRVLRGVGVWVKPMKFMAATALFAWTTVWAAELANSEITHGPAYVGICALLVLTSGFEVAYITYKASQGVASHYNTSDAWHAFMFGLMGMGAVGLTASQAWLAWELWQARGSAPLPVTAWGVILGLFLTFVLATISGFMLGGKQPPEGAGLPLVGWHSSNDIRPSHFLGVHAQQIIPIWGIGVDRLLGPEAIPVFALGCGLYLVLWVLVTLKSVKS